MTPAWLQRPGVLDLLRLSLILVGLTAALFVQVDSAQAETLETTNEAVLVRLVQGAGSRLIQDSKWGMVGALQKAINDWAGECGVEPVERDGRFGPATAAAAQQVALCKGVELADAAVLTGRAFEAIVGAPAPGALERARILTHTLEGMDYDRLDWNICSNREKDRASVLTWGPYGKTLGWGGEMLGVLKRVDRRRVLAVFEAEGARGGEALLGLKTKQELKVQSQHRYPGARALMERICAAPGQKGAWQRAFERLGADPAVRRAYQEVAWGDEAWFRYVVERLNRAWRDAGLEPTEVDHAFFVDRSIHMGWGNIRFAAVEQALARAKAADPAGFSSAKARFAVAAAVAPKARPEDRVARDAIFLVDAAEELGGLPAKGAWPANWRALWLRRSGLSAADLGLSDARPAPGFDDALRLAEAN